MNDKIKYIVEHYGEGLQLLKLAEECAEYSAAMLKWDGYRKLLGASGLDVFKGKRDQAGAKCMEELADVLVLARQVEYLMTQDEELRAMLEKLMEEKCDRQIERIKEEFFCSSAVKLDLRDTIDNMISDDFRERLIAEYQQLSIRKNKLGNYLWAIKEGKAPAIEQKVYTNLWEQFRTMRKYKRLLEEKARLIKLNLKEIHHA